MSANEGRRRGRPRDQRARFRVVAGRMREELAAGQWKAGEVLPSIRDLAEHFDVGVNTLRQAIGVLRREGRVAVSARGRLVARPPAGCRSIAEGITLLVAAGGLERLLEGRYSPEVLHGIQAEIGRTGAPFLVLHGGQYQEAPPTDALDLPLRGVVLFGIFRDEVLDEYERLSVPVVAADMSCPGRRLHSIGINNAEAAREAVARVAALGHRNIAYLRLVNLAMGEVDQASRERGEGVRQGVRDAGLPRSALRIFNSVSGDTPTSPAIRAILDLRRRFTVVLAASAGRAELVISAAEQAGLRVPGDISVVCFQGVRASHPHISGMRTDFREIGRRAVRMLSDPRRPPRHVIVPAVWVAGRTLRPPS